MSHISFFAGSAGVLSLARAHNAGPGHRGSWLIPSLLLCAACASTGSARPDEAVSSAPPPFASSGESRGNDRAPVHTRYTVAPRLLNGEEVVRALDRHYPVLLREAGIGGKVIVWCLVDEEGKVLKTQLGESSSYEALDAAALKVASSMKFSPAYDGDRKVQVWVQLPVRFTPGQSF